MRDILAKSMERKRLDGYTASGSEMRDNFA